MQFLYVGTNDLISRHELGFISSLARIGEVDIVMLGTDNEFPEKLFVESDNGIASVRVLGSYEQLNRIDISRIVTDLVVNPKDFDAIFFTPREPLIISLLLRKRLRIHCPLILRLWSIRAAKLKDNLRFGALSDISLFLPSIVANMSYIALSDASITVDHATYHFAKSIYPLYAGRIFRMYPPAGFLLTEPSEIDEEISAKIESLGDYILGITSLQKTGSYLKFEAKPHALILYSIARRLKDVNVVLAGSDIKDWMKVFPNLKIPENFHLVGRGFSDQLLKLLYGNADLVIMPITNRNISNRLLEALYFSKPLVTTEIVKLIHPELKHREHVYISHWDNIVDDVIRVHRKEDLLSDLQKGAKEAYNRLFSTEVNSLFARKILRSFYS